MRSALTALLLLLAAPAAAQDKPAVIDDAAWIAGRWVGDGLGGTAEESWSPPMGGQMAGTFTLVRGGKPVFYELMLIDVQPGGLRLRVKHFNADFTAWEDKGGWHSFEPISAAPGDLRFKGLSLRRQGDELLITVTLRENDGTVKDHLLRMRRAG